ncbi:MAG TPA: DUF952 domain-containing protein [Stellaceae bacterium]|nr:DUF952 domain-containing protein [Stellaceae bacterium]
MSSCGATGAVSSSVYKILAAAEWHAAMAAGVFVGSAVDKRDGYIHLSTAAQVRETAARHFAGQSDLVLVAFDDGALGPALRWEPSRGGALFPHLYASLDPRAARWAQPLPLGRDGIHVFPPLDGEA